MKDIETRIHAAIRPQLDRADELLDYYTEGLPREVWEPIAAQCRPKTFAELYMDGVSNFVEHVAPQLLAAQEALIDGYVRLIHAMNEPVPPIPEQP